MLVHKIYFPVIDAAMVFVRTTAFFFLLSMIVTRDWMCQSIVILFSFPILSAKITQYNLIVHRRKVNFYVISYTDYIDFFVFRSFSQTASI